MGSMLSFLQYKNHKSRQISHTELWPFIEEVSVLDVGGEATTIRMFPSFRQRAATAPDSLLSSHFASAVMPFAQRCHRVSNSERRLTGFNNAASFFFSSTPLCSTSLSLLLLCFHPQRIYHPIKHTLLFRTASPPPSTHPPFFPAQPLSKDSDWMTPCCRYPALLKSIFLSVSVAPAPQLPFPRYPTRLPSSSWDPSVRSNLSPFGVAVGSTLECSNYPSK